MKRRKGHQVEYQGKKYDSLSELSKDLELPYSSIVHNYYRTKNVDKAVKIAQKAKEAEIYVVWGKKYCSVSKMANVYGISPATISKKLKQGKTVEEALAEILKKEVIFFQGKEFLGLTELSCYYGQDVSLIWERLSNGMNLEEALFSPIRRRNKPQCKIKYHGITYESKRDFSRKMKISVGCIHEMMVNNNVDFETVADILLEVKEKAGIPADRMISRIPMCIIRGKEYKSIAELASELKITTRAISTYKARNGCAGILEALVQMQREKREKHIIGGKAVSYEEMRKMGYSKYKCGKVPKQEFPLYPQLIGYDFVTDCVDVAQIYAEVKAEKLEQLRGMIMEI